LRGTRGRRRRRRRRRRRNVMAYAQKPISSYGETDESIQIGGGVNSVDY
jgi:hypothetical protein